MHRIAQLLVVILIALLTAGGGVAGARSGETVLTYPHPDLRLKNGTEVTYLHRDHLSSVRTMTNAAGARAAGQVYVPFGEQVQIGAPLDPEETKGFIGERYDSDAGLQYLNARYYDPRLGMFIQPDWFEVTKKGVGTNRYSYSFNDPVNLRDPGGNEGIMSYDGYYHTYQAIPPSTHPNVVVRFTANVGIAVLNTPISAGNLVADVLYGTGELLAPYAGTMENVAMTTPTAVDDIAAVGINAWGRLSTSVAQRAAAIRQAEFAAQEITDFFSHGNVPKASELSRWAEAQGWTYSRSPTGPIKYFDSNKVERLTIKSGSARTPGSEHPHASVRDTTGKQIDPRTGEQVSPRSEGNHRDILYDLKEEDIAELDAAN